MNMLAVAELASEGYRLNKVGSLNMLRWPSHGNTNLYRVGL